MSRLAMFNLKYPSRLQLDHDSRQNDATRTNPNSLDGIVRGPAPTYIYCPVKLMGAGLRCYRFGKGLDGHYLLSLNGGGYVSSSKIDGPNCCQKHYRDGRLTYYH